MKSLSSLQPSLLVQMYGIQPRNSYWAPVRLCKRQRSLCYVSDENELAPGKIFLKQAKNKTFFLAVIDCHLLTKNKRY